VNPRLRSSVLRVRSSFPIIDCDVPYPRDQLGARTLGDFDGEGLFFLFEGDELDFHQAVVVKSFGEARDECIRRAGVAELEDGVEQLRAGLEVALEGWVQVQV